MDQKPEWWEKLPAFKSGDSRRQFGAIANNISALWLVIAYLLIHQWFGW